MFRSSKTVGRENAGGVGAVLASLTSCSVVDLHSGWFVVSDTGHFVVTDGQNDLPNAARNASLLAASVRQDLEQSVAITPLVQPLVASVRKPSREDLVHAEENASVVPIDLLARTLTEGPKRRQDDSPGSSGRIGFGFVS